MKVKRGMSDVVSTTLLVLITIAAAAVLTSFIMPFVKNGLSSSSECLPYKNTFKFEPSYGYNCFDSANLSGISVRGNAPDNEAEMPIQFSAIFRSENGETRRVDFVNGSATSSNIGKVALLDRTKTAILIPKAGEVQTYVYNGEMRFTKVEIYPVTSNGKICDKSDSIEL
ncbi:MAG TPA: hypothetical protein VHA12_04105, partial [Candidatus Nanoarchaeia archaeon]|nr:hypothetical protein [Candidatus Nanoarchaeia archaeon]